jgi:DNA mismatch repair ATPase MutS
VLIDELGRGTEYRAGTAIAAAVLEAISSAGSVGLFSTHLHALLDLDLATDRPIARAAMGVARDGSKLKATYVATIVPLFDSIAIF